MLSAVSSAEIAKFDLNLSAAYWSASTYININPWTGAAANASSYANDTYPLGMYYCGAFGGSISQVGGTARWAAATSAEQYSAWGAPTVFVAGDVIDSSTIFLTSHDASNYNDSAMSSAGFNFLTEETQYLGFSYTNGTDVHYGYLEFHITPNTTFAYGNDWDDPIITFTGAYVNMTPGEGITIGSAIPEPSSVALLFGVTAVGAVAWHRRRHKAASA
jgi:PEP-CTERM putative exosortase interaction domain